MRFPLRYTIPIVLILFTAVLAVWSLKTNGRIAMDRVEKDMRSELTSILTLLQDSIEHELGGDKMARVQQQISGYGSDDHLKSLFLIDEAGEVVAATQFSRLGLDGENFLPAESRDHIKKRLKSAQEKYAAMIFPSPDNNTLWGITPVQMGFKEGDVRPTRVGVLIAQMDLVGPRTLALNLVKTQVFQFVFFLSILVVGLGVLLNFQITRRIEQLVLATEKFAMGDFEFPVNVDGRDEITVLAKAMTKMVKMRKWTENELRESEEENRSIIISAMDGIVSFDENGIVRSINPAAEGIFGYKVEEVVGKNVEIFMRDVYNKHSGHFLPFSSEDDAKLTGPLQEVSGKRKDGSYFPLEISVSEMHKESQLIFVVIVRDISERKKIENELERYSSELKLTNEELEKFVYTASHDLQEPLRKVIIFGGRLEEACSGKLGEDETACIHRMQKASFRMKDLINDLLGYSRLKYQAASFEPVDLNLLAEEVIDDLEAQMILSEGKVQFGELPVVVGDKIQLRQLFQNLISNSLKYVQLGVPPIIVIKYRVNDQGCCELSFLDNGSGFDEKYTNKVFEPFQRLNSNSDIRGTGMGMFICKKIVERHHGSITVNSTPDKGTNFIITLPETQPV